jgi:pimeloyl-ACP methyl ester carboxylesterase
MTCEHHKAAWFWTVLSALSLSLLVRPPPAMANEADGLRVTDYFVTHTSNEPFYLQQKLDPHVTLHVREVVLPGRERTVIKDGKVLLFIHGASIPGYVSFDTDYANCSVMRYFANAGWDTFTLDLEGFGLSTRPLVMETPTAFPDSKAPMHTDVTVHDVERVVDFINALRGTEKIYLLGWSQGASLEAPLYTIQHPNRVSKLVLFGVSYDPPGSTDERKRMAADREVQKVRYAEPSLKDWVGLGTKEEFVTPGCFDAYRRAHLASDPRSGEFGNAVRVPWGRSIDQGLFRPHFDATKITVPTLVIRGDADTFATSEDNQRLVSKLGTNVKEFVQIPGAGHFLQFEKANAQLYQAVQRFLDASQ